MELKTQRWKSMSRTKKIVTSLIVGTFMVGAGFVTVDRVLNGQEPVSEAPKVQAPPSVPRWAAPIAQSPAKFPNSYPVQSTFPQPPQNFPAMATQPAYGLPPSATYASAPNGSSYQVSSMNNFGQFNTVGFDPEDVQLTKRSYELSTRIRTSKMEKAEKEKTLKDLRSVVEEQFDGRQERRNKELQELKDRVEELEKSIKDRTGKKEQIVTNRVNQLIGQSDWEEFHGPQGINVRSVPPNFSVPPASFPQAIGIPPSPNPPAPALGSLPAQGVLPGVGLLQNVVSPAEKIERLERELIRMKGIEKELEDLKGTPLFDEPSQKPETYGSGN